LCCGGILFSVPGVASASFPGTNGDLVWAAICNSNNGQQIFSAPNSASGETCPGGTGTSYNPVTSGYDDSMPYFSPSGSTVYFASQRNSNSAIYSIAYPNTASGTTDSAVQLTFPSGVNDYAPTVNAANNELAFIRCTSSTTCDIWTMSLPSGTATNTGIATAAPGDVTTGTADRPEFDPANSNLMVYEGTNDHIMLVTLTTPTSPTDLSAESGLPSGGVDEHPDWAPDGNAIVFDSTRQYDNSTSGDPENNGYAIFVMTNLTSTTPTVTPRWQTVPANTSQIEPVYAPGTTNDSSATLAWVSEVQGANVVVDYGTSVNSPDNVTQNHTNNVQVVWQPASSNPALPESPLTIGLPVAAGGILVGAGFLMRRRSNRPTAA
jgi:Tol biopolymer transport system component